MGTSSNRFRRNDSVSDVIQQVDVLIRARYPIVYLVTWEEDRALQFLLRIARKQKKNLAVWTCTDGLRTAEVARGRRAVRDKGRKPLEALNAILQDGQPCVYVLKDFHPYLDDPVVVRHLRDLCHALKRSYKTVVILSPKLELPFELQKSVAVVDLPVPDRRLMNDLLNELIRDAAEHKAQVSLTPDDRERLVSAVLGLTLDEAERVFAQSLVRDAKFDAADIDAVLAEKKQIVRKSGLLEYYSPQEGMDDVGGLDLLKAWLGKRARAFSDAARDYGLPRPKGVLILGVQGCGKSLTAKALATLWNLPLLRFDVSRIFDRFIGSSEMNMRHALQTAESIAPAILWVDEIEKAFSGVQSSGVTDAGTTSRVFGTFITWLQENPSMVFAIATANSIENLPPELLRKGRFDEIFFVGLPAENERKAIFAIHLRKRERDPADFDLPRLAGLTEGFSGAEIEQAIIDALFNAYDDGRELTSDDLVRSIADTVPLSRTMREEIDGLRTWAADRTRPASSAQAPSQ
jgi:ATP-dependent 26S proteasome regulatory subunit